MNPIALMIDIETLGLGMRSVVTQVGYVVGNLATGEVYAGPFDIWMDAYEQRDRQIDFDTVRWWMKQDRAVQDAVLDTPEGVPRCSAEQVFVMFKELVAHHSCDVWASPAMFDLSILTDLFGGKKPWSYDMERDMMTVRRWVDPDRKLAPPENDQQHLASADAQWQFDYLCKLYRRMQSLQ